ncbi:MAG: sensor histidine kinase [Deltaproteobacteria bacterium]|nr:sensor histidine kinase [Deltaproteobacteria bacterium]
MRLVCAVLAIMMVLDLGSMMVLEHFLSPEPRLLWHIAASLSLALLLLPAFYLLVFRPMWAETQMRARAEEELWEIHRSLERQVGERTAELRRTNERLQEQIREASLAREELRQSEAQLRVLSGELVQAQESERARVARDLHDGIGQTLTAIKFLLEHGVERIQAGEAPEDALGSLVPRIKGAVEEVRRICMDLRPSTLDELGVLPTIAWFCREFQEAFPGLRIERRIEVGEDAIPEVLKITIYRLLQEAMNNVAKHSGAERVRIDLSGSDGGLVLAVEDDGTGFGERVLPAAGDDPGFGLKSMRQRAELSGGTLAIRSGEHGGVTVEACWPAEALRRLRG